MKSHRPEVADALRSFETDYRERYPLSADQARVVSDLTACRTAALGGHQLACDACGHQEISYNSCRNRHCPKCQASARAEWLAEREKDLLDVSYFHVVFTLPHELGPIALQNKRLLYGLLFRSAAQTLQTIAKDPAHLGAEIGFLAVLHTWSQNLLHHPHVHCVVPGGGISLDGHRWVPCRKNFLLPVAVLSRFFRRRFLDQLQACFAAGEVSLHGKLEPLREPTQWHQLIAKLRQREWVVYAKPPFGGPLQVLKYLARYTHRVAISNGRLVSIQDDSVTFRWKDYAHGNRQRLMTLSGVEFLRRFLLHVLPKGLMRIRHYGFLANRARETKLTLARALIAEDRNAPATLSDDDLTTRTDSPLQDSNRRPRCGEGTMRVVGEIPPTAPSHPESNDTS